MYWSLFLIKLKAFRCFSVNIAKLLRAAFFIGHFRWLLLVDDLFYIIFSKRRCWICCSIHCIIISFWNLRLLSFVSFAFIYCTTCYHSFSLVVIHCHSLYYSLSFVVPHIIVIRCHSLSLVVPLVGSRCTTRLSFYKRSPKSISSETYHET